MLRALLIAAALLPAGARALDAAPDASADIVVTGHDGITPSQRRVPQQLNGGERAAYRQIFLDIDAGRTSAAEAGLAAMPADGVLTGTAKAQLLIARGLGKASLDDMNAWLAANADLPQAPKVMALVQRIGAPVAALPVPHMMRTVSFGTPLSPRAAQGFGLPGDTTLAARLKPLLAADRNAEAEVQWQQLSSAASEPVATEWAQRTAWSYYIGGDDAAAMRMAGYAAQGSGEWAALGAWVVGLAAYRENDCEAASRSFDAVAFKLPGEDLSAAAAYWAYRAHNQCNRPAEARARLTRAAAYADRFYGILARRVLGQSGTGYDWVEPDFITADWNTLSKLPGAKRAAALVEIGQLGLADRELKYLATTADPTAYAPLLRLSARLNLPATQYWLAQHPPLGQDTPLSARFPAPDWRPAGGWRVDRNLVFAHALQESNFQTTATSRTGAKGIMQLMPATAKLLAVRMADGTEVQVAAMRDLTDPEFNIECGQSYLQSLRDMSYTGGLLPKVIAAYNAGPGSVQKWNTTLRDNADPLLFIESIPYKETRHYVQVVLRNFWMYQLRDGAATPSLDALSRDLWPKFPGMTGQDGVKVLPTFVAPPVPGYLQPTLPTDDMVVASAG